jgi:PadR family transcriptional regulator, regulatory protein AphA
MELPTTAYLILGMLRLGARSGYDVKQMVELSTRVFWTISHAQIYPTLKRLEADGLVRGEAEPRGNRPRRVYELTELGEQALEEWLRNEEPLAFEVRDVAMLKLFFADGLEAEEALDHVRAMRARSEQTLERLRRQSEPAARGLQEAGNRFPLHMLSVGLAVHRALVDVCVELEGELGKAR